MYSWWGGLAQKRLWRMRREWRLLEMVRVVAYDMLLETINLHWRFIVIIDDLAGDRSLQGCVNILFGHLLLSLYPISKWMQHGRWKTVCYVLGFRFRTCQFHAKFHSNLLRTSSGERMSAILSSLSLDRVPGWRHYSLQGYENLVYIDYASQQWREKNEKRRIVNFNVIVSCLFTDWKSPSLWTTKWK